MLSNFLGILYDFSTPVFFNSAIISIWTKKLLTEENICFLIQNIRGLTILIGKNN